MGNLSVLYRKSGHGLSGSMLKLLAVLSMTVDHTAAVCLAGVGWAEAPLFHVADHPVTWYWFMRCFGRLAFPLFCFLLVEGYRHTSNRCRYGLRLMLFAGLSEIPYDLAMNGGSTLSGQNVFLTLLLGFVGMCLYDCTRRSRFDRTLALVMMTCLVFLCRADYGITGFWYIMLLYMYPLYRGIVMGGVGLLLPIGGAAALAAVPAAVYNGRRGFIKARWMRNLFYAWYPVHLIFLWWLERWRDICFS